MSNNISFNKFYNINSDIRKMNPVIKILCVLIFIALTFLENSVQFYSILFIMTFCIIYLSNIPFKQYLKIIIGLLSFIIFIFLINFLCKTSLYYSISLSLRLILIVLYSSILTFSTPPSELIYGLEKILSPLKIFKIPVNSLALVLALSIRFIPNVFYQGKAIIKNYESKGIKFTDLSIPLKLKYIKSIIVPMFVLSIKKSDELSDSMLLKLYDSNSIRSSLIYNSFNRIDAYMLSLHFTLIFVLVMKVIL